MSDEKSGRTVATTDFRFARDAIGGITAAYENYIRLLNDELNEVSGLAHVHGWRSSRVELGEAARKRIESALALWQTEVDWHEGRALDSLVSASESATASSKPKEGEHDRTID